ncbi:MAG: GNAT family N-acetyltransferase [Eubacteriales bacterium]
MYEISFRPLHADDMPDMYRWLTTDFVHQWYARKTEWTEQKVIDKYLPSAQDKKTIDSFVIMCDDSKIGYIQSYKTADYPDYWACLDTGLETAGIDLFIGEPDFLHKGLGKKILQKFLKEMIFSLYPDITHCTIGPEVENTAAIAAYKKAGFTYLKTADITHKNEQEYLLIMSKQEAMDLY